MVSLFTRLVFFHESQSPLSLALFRGIFHDTHAQALWFLFFLLSDFKTYARLPLCGPMHLLLVEAWFVPIWSLP